MMNIEIRSSIEIDAPIDVAWRVLTDLGAYRRWNPFVVCVEGAEAPVVGADVVLHVRWADGSGVTARDRVTEAWDHGDHRGFAWDYQGALTVLGLLRSSRRLTLTALGVRRCRHESTEVFRGILTPALPRRRIQDGFERMAVALRSESERLHRSRCPDAPFEPAGAVEDLSA
jgi:hypothetical protein